MDSSEVSFSYICVSQVTTKKASEQSQKSALG